MNRGIITKLAFAIVILCFLLSTFVSLWSLRIMARQNMQELSKTLAARICDTIGGELSEPVTVARTMANNSFIVEMLEHEQGYNEAEFAHLMTRYLSGIREGLDCQAAFLVSAASGRYYAASGGSKIIDPQSGGRDSWYADFMARGNAYELDIDPDEFGQDAWTVFVDTRIEDDAGKLLGVCGVGIRFTGTQELFSALERDHGVKINLVAPDGLVMVDTDQSRMETARVEGLALSEADDYRFQTLGRGSYAVTKYIDNLGWYLVVTSDGRGQTGQFINVILLNVVLCALVMVILVIAIRIIIARTRALTHASFRDQTTQLLNRRAFEEEKAALAEATLDADFTYITADVNGLKTVNDTLGHAAGDELIKGAADCLKTCLGRYGKIFRIGGDEFAAMLRLPQDDLKPTMDRLQQTVAGWSGEKVGELSVSCGWATSREFPSENIAELSRVSDERMYAAKEEHYRATGKRRRGETGT